MPNFEQHPLHPGDHVRLFIAGGPLKEPAQAEPFYDMEEGTIPLTTWGGFTLNEWTGNGEPDFDYDSERHAAGNSRDLPNGGKEAIIALKPVMRRLQEMGAHTIIQVTNLPHEKPIDVIPKLVEIAAESEPTAVEVNFGCPNGKNADGSFHPPLYREPEACGEVLQKVRERVGDDVVLAAKDGPHTDSPDVMPSIGTVSAFASATSPYIDAVVGINTIASQSFPALTKTGGKGGMSGPIVADVAYEHAKLWNVANPDMAYLSTGGIDAQNIEAEASRRFALPNVIRIGGAQEFYRQGRAAGMARLALEWAQRIA